MAKVRYCVVAEVVKLETATLVAFVQFATVAVNVFDTVRFGTVKRFVDGL